jgi:hypothetical protein
MVGFCRFLDTKRKYKKKIFYAIKKFTLNVNHLDENVVIHFRLVMFYRQYRIISFSSVLGGYYELNLTSYINTVHEVSSRAHNKASVI